MDTPGAQMVREWVIRRQTSSINEGVIPGLYDVIGDSPLHQHVESETTDFAISFGDAITRHIVVASVLQINCNPDTEQLNGFRSCTVILLADLGRCQTFSRSAC